MRAVRGWGSGVGVLLVLRGGGGWASGAVGRSRGRLCSMRGAGVRGWRHSVRLVRGFGVDGCVLRGWWGHGRSVAGVGRGGHVEGGRGVWGGFRV